MRTKIVFHVDAGRFESDGEKNYKYCDHAETLADAIQMYEMALPRRDLSEWPEAHCLSRRRTDG